MSIIRVADKFSENLLTLSIAACEQLTDSCVAYLLDRLATVNLQSQCNKWNHVQKPDTNTQVFEADQAGCGIQSLLRGSLRGHIGQSCPIFSEAAGHQLVQHVY